MKTHTEGNWITSDGQIYPQETGKTLALIPYFNKEDKEQEANAKLIAAAPDLLEALIIAGLYLHNSDRVLKSGKTLRQIVNNAIENATK